MRFGTGPNADSERGSRSVGVHMRDLFVVVSGAPGSGKSTLARAIAPLLDLPLIEKDVIKEALADELGAVDVDASKRLGKVTMAVMIGLARVNRGAVLE